MPETEPEQKSLILPGIRKGVKSEGRDSAVKAVFFRGAFLPESQRGSGYWRW
jgi:hypothetical protein